jgi:hypothetical protein
VLTTAIASTNFLKAVLRISRAHQENFYPRVTFQSICRTKQFHVLKQRVFIFNQCGGGGAFFDFLERIRPKNKLGEFQFWGRDLLQKRKNKKQQILSFRSSKIKIKNPRIGSTNQTQFGLDSGYFKGTMIPVPIS